MNAKHVKMKYVFIPSMVDRITAGLGGDGNTICAGRITSNAPQPVCVDITTLLVELNISSKGGCYGKMAVVEPGSDGHSEWWEKYTLMGR